jgi:hypothetical protein
MVGSLCADEPAVQRLEGVGLLSACASGLMGPSCSAQLQHLVGYSFDFDCHAAERMSHDGPNIPVPAPQVATVIAATITVTAWPAVEGFDRWQVSVSFVKRAERQSAGRSLWLRSRRWLTVTTYPSRLGQPGRYTWRGDRRLNDGDQDHHDVQDHCALV